MQENKVIQSRESWRWKAKQRRVENKNLKRCLDSSRKSRDYWKGQSIVLAQELDQLKEDLAEEKKRTARLIAKTD